MTFVRCGAVAQHKYSAKWFAEKRGFGWKLKLRDSDMDDVTLSARLDESSTIYVTPLARETYEEHAGTTDLGGEDGYFVVRATRDGMKDRIEVLAKAASFQAAGDLFDLIVRSGRAS